VTDETARLARAEQAAQAFNEFVGPALAVIREEYLAKLQDIASTQAMAGVPLAMVEKLSTAIKITNQIEIQLRALIADGDVAKAELHRAGDMARLSNEQKRYASY
jgi:hypothetical protein